MNAAIEGECRSCRGSFDAQRHESEEYQKGFIINMEYQLWGSTAKGLAQKRIVKTLLN